MEELDLAQNILSDILDNDVSFSEGLRKVFQADVEKRPLRNIVAGLLGCELRHHLLFTYLCEPLEALSVEEKRFLSLALADAYFFKRIPMEALHKALTERLGPTKIAVAEPLLAKADKPETFIPVDLPKSSNKYLSLRYNTPEWVLKIWEHYGYGTTYKILKKNNRPLVSTLRVASPLNIEEFLNNNPDFVKAPIDNMLVYGGKIPLRKINEFHDGKIFLEKMATKKLLDEHKVAEPSEAFFYNGNSDPSILLEAIETYGSSIGLNIGVYDVANYPAVGRFIHSKGLKNVNFFGADPSAMEASISRPQDLVVVSPNSSNFDLIREYPDYLLHFKKGGMDTLFAQEKVALEGCSKFVAEKGILIYMIYTISKKEGHNTVNEFLLNHREFALLEEKQLFPYEELDTAMYYAILKKDTSLAKKAVPLQAITKPVEVAPLTNEASSKAQ